MAESETSTGKKAVVGGLTKLAQAVEIATLVIALFLVVGAILVAFRGSINEDSGLVTFVKDVAGFFDGPFSRSNGVFDFSGDSAETRNALANWGVAAVIWLIVGRIVGRVIRP